MAFGDQDLDSLFADMGVMAITDDEQSATVILDTPETLDLMGTESAMGKTDFEIRYQTSQLQLSSGKAITVDGNKYTVRSVQKIDDGKVSKALLKTVS